MYKLSLSRDLCPGILCMHIPLSNSHWGYTDPPGRNLTVASVTVVSNTVTALVLFWMLGLVLERTYHSAQVGQIESSHHAGHIWIRYHQKKKKWDLQELWKVCSDGICQCAKLRGLYLPLHVNLLEWGMSHPGFWLEEACNYWEDNTYMYKCVVSPPYSVSLSLCPCVLWCNGSAVSVMYMHCEWEILTFTVFASTYILKRETILCTRLFPTSVRGA